jgi:hypothetical protein
MTASKTQPSPTERYFIGMTTVAREHWLSFVREPEATRSSKPESVQKERDAKRAKQEEKSASTPIMATALHIVIINQTGEIVFEIHQPEKEIEGNASYSAMRFLANALAETGLEVGHNKLVDTNVRLFGFDIRERLRLMSLDAMRFAVIKKVPLRIPIGLWYHRTFEAGAYLDPYEAFIPSELRGDIDFSCLCDFLNIPSTAVNLDAAPHVQAELARQLAIIGQMFIAE